MSEQSADVETPRVVSIEDNPGDIRLIEEGIAALDSGIELVQYTNGQRALSALVDSDERIDLLLLDMNIPGKSGLEILHRLRTERADDSPPVVVVSSSENPEDVRRVYEESANAYIKKPADPDEFIRRVVGAVRFWVPETREDN